MDLNEILNWISKNGLAAFFIGCFLTTLVGIVANFFHGFFIGVARAVTGKYPPPPPPRPVVQCDCEPCLCCRDDCQEGCGCYEEEDE